MSDDIMFCYAYCDNLSCRRNMANIQDWSKAHSWMFMEDVPDCPLDDRIKVIRCKECQRWDTKSGLSARMCSEWGKFTTQNEFCSRGRVME